MRGWIAGAAGVAAGAVLGAGAVVGLEAVVGATVALTMALSEREPVPDAVGSAPVAMVGRAPAAERYGELQLITMAAVQVLVDGGPIDFDLQQGYVQRLVAGQHRVQILGLTGGTIADQAVDIAADQRTQLRYANKALVDQGRMPIRGAASPRVTVAPAPLAVTLPSAPLVTLPTLVDIGAPTLSIGSGPAAVEIKLPKVQLGRRD